MKNSVKKLETFMPIFNGFYGTIWGLDEQIERFLDYEDDNISFEDLKIDYEKYKNDLLKGIGDWIVKNFDFVKSIRVQKINSPKYYNYSNDSCDIEIEIDVVAFSKYLIENKESLNKYLYDTYTSRDGFISHYDNDYQSWFEDTKGFTEFQDEHKLGSLLEFYYLDNFREFDCYYSVIDDFSIEEYIEVIKFDKTKFESYERYFIIKTAIENDEIDFSFGYMNLIYNEAMQKDPENWIEYLIDKYELDLFNEIKSDLKFNQDYELV